MKRIVHLTGRAVRALGALAAFFILSSAGALSASAAMQADYWPADDWVSTGGVRTAVLPFVWSAGQKPEVDESLSE